MSMLQLPEMYEAHVLKYKATVRVAVDNPHKAHIREYRIMLSNKSI